MNLNKFISTSSLTAALLMPFLLPTSAQAVALSQDDKIEGVIVSRDGDSFVVRGNLGATTNIILTKSTKIDRLKGLIGVRSDDVGADTLIPGLRVSVEPETPGKQTTNAKSIQFHADDLETASEIQGALTIPQHQILALIAKVNAQEKELSAQKELQAQQIAALKTDMDTGFATADERFGKLDQYDVQA